MEADQEVDQDRAQTQRLNIMATTVPEAEVLPWSATRSHVLVSTVLYHNVCE